MARALWSNRVLQLMVPYQVCFGISAGFVDTYINGVIVNRYIGDGYIGLLSGLSILVAVLLAYPLAQISNRVRHGKYYIMVAGGVCFACAGLPLLFFSDRTIGQWAFLVPYFAVHGAARGIWENTNKAVVAEYFAPDGTAAELRDAAFAAVYFTSGLAGAFGYLFFKFMSRGQLAALNICVSVAAIAAYHFSWRQFLHEARECKSNSQSHAQQRSHMSGEVVTNQMHLAAAVGGSAAHGDSRFSSTRYSNIQTLGEMD